MDTKKEAGKSPNEEVFRIALTRRLFAYTGVPSTISILIYNLYLIIKEGLNTSTILVLTFFTLGTATILILGLLDAINNKLTIDEKAITYTSTFSDCKLTYDEIKGYISNNKYITIKPIDKSKKGIRISTAIEKKDMIISWLDSNFIDLQKQAQLQELASILTNKKKGKNEGQQARQFKNAQTLSSALNWAGCITGASCLWDIKAFPYIAAICVAVPISAILLSKCYPGMIHIDKKKGSLLPSVSHSIIVPSIALAASALLHFNLVDSSLTCLHAAWLSVILTWAILYKNPEFEFNQAQTLFSGLGFALILFAYSYGSIAVLNCSFDQSPKSNYGVKIVNKSDRMKAFNIHKLQIRTEYPRVRADEINVSDRLFKSVHIGDSVRIYQQKGLVGLPWIAIGDKIE